MATINGRRVKLLKEEGQPIGTAREWKSESDWMKVITDDGVTYMVHYTDKIEIIRQDHEQLCWCGKVTVFGEKVCPEHESDLIGKSYSPEECHCGKDGHALNSINCPVHGYEIKSP